MAELAAGGCPLYSDRLGGLKGPLWICSPEPGAMRTEATLALVIAFRLLAWSMLANM